MNLVTEKDIERIVHFNIKTFVHFDIDIYNSRFSRQKVLYLTIFIRYFSDFSDDGEN